MEQDPDMKCQAAASVNSILGNFLGSTNVTYLKGSQITAAIFKDLSAFGIVYFSGHGSTTDDSSYAISTGEEYSATRELQLELEADQNSKSINYYFTKFQTAWDSRLLGKADKTTFGIKAAFINDYSKTLPGSLIYFDSCEGLSNQSMAQAFVNKGAAAYLGWSWVVSDYLGVLNNTTSNIFSSFVAGKTIAEAMSARPTDYNFADLGWYSTVICSKH